MAENAAPPVIPDVVARTVPAFFAHRHVTPDPPFERDFSAHLKSTCTESRLKELYDRFDAGSADFDALMRRIVLRALVRRLGDAVFIGRNVRWTHPETFDIGDGVWIGDQACLQGRFDGSCCLGDRVWIGPQCFLDARALVVEAAAGFGPGARVLGSTHTGHPPDEPVLATDLNIRPVRVCTGADIGVNAVILPGVTVGAGAIVGAGAVVTRDVAPRTVVAGVPAEFLRERDE